MAHVLTEIALQLKGTLAFLLGLGGMFTIVKGLLTGLLVLPKISSERPSIKSDAAKLRSRITVLAVVSLVLFVIAVCTYFSAPMSTIDADALRKSRGYLTAPQQWATAIISVIAIALVAVESVVSVLKYQFDLLAKSQ